MSIGSLQKEPHSELQPVGIELRPPPPPQLSSFDPGREPDSPPPTWCGSGSPARGCVVVVKVWTGAGGRHAGECLTALSSEVVKQAERRR
jgi:hypothetical protein